jgi:hypothetical protein
MTIPLIIMAFVMAFFLYKKVRVDLFRDRVFKIRRSLFLIAARNPDAFFKDNTCYRFFEAILNATLSYTEDFSFAGIALDKLLRRQYIGNHDAAYFDYFKMKENYLAKVKSGEIKDKVSKLMDGFLFHYGMFLYTRTIWETLIFSVFVCFAFFYFALKTAVGKQPVNPLEKETIKESICQPTARMMNNTQFAYAAAQVYAV